MGNADAPITLVEYGSYACRHCHAMHEVIADLRDRLGDRMRYVFRHRPISGSDDAERAAELAEYASETTGQFWNVHDALMKQGTTFSDGDFERIASDFELPPSDAKDGAAWQAAVARVAEDIRSAQHSGVLETPTFFINNRRYEGPWDESSLAEAMLGSLGHRLHAATVDFVRWAPSAGLSLLLMSVLAVLLVNSPIGPAFQSWWDQSFGFQLGGSAFALPLLDWVNDGLLTIFFLVVGLEIKREFTVGRLATRHAAALPIVAAFGGMTAPALIYLLVVPPGPLHAGWGMTIATDTAFAVALIVLLGTRVPVELRVFLTAAVIMDDLVAIVVIALFYTGNIDLLLSGDLGCRDRLAGGAQSVGRVPFVALRGTRSRSLGLPAWSGTPCDVGRSDPCCRDSDPSAGELTCADGTGRGGDSGRDQARRGSRHAARAVGTGPAGHGCHP